LAEAAVTPQIRELQKRFGRSRMPWEAVLASAARALRMLEKIDMTRRIDRVKTDNALQTLRQIFFYSSELKNVLEDIEAGRQIEPEVVEFYARNFRSPPIHIQEALSYIENERFEDRNTLLIEDIELMNQIKHGKLDTRREISRFFERYLAEVGRGKNSLAIDASRILGQIERFNASVQKLESKLLAARNSDAATTRPPRASRSRNKRG
jgi:hypothetical protein